MNPHVRPSGCPEPIARRDFAWLDVLPLALYLPLSAVLTWPLLLHLRTDIAGDAGDSLHFIWNLWWTRKAVLDPGLALFHTDYLFHPAGVNLAFHTLSLFNGFISIPLQSVLGLVGTYNILILLGFVLGGWGGYLLCHELTCSRTASVFGGIVFGFSPFHVANAMADLNIASLQFIPFVFLFFVRWQRRGRLLDAALTGFFLGLSALCSWYYLVFGAFGITVLLIVWILSPGTRPPALGLVKAVALLAVATAAVILPAVLPMIRAAAEGSIPNPGRQDAYSADLLAYLVPSPHHPLFRSWVSPFYGKVSGNLWENTITTGVVALFLSVVALHGKRRLRDDHRRAWLVLALAAGILSLGPTLQIAGGAVGKSGMLPYRWLVQSVPLLSQVRIPSRFAVLVLSGAAVLAAFGFRDLLGSPRVRKHAWKRRGLSALLFVLLIAEFWCLPFPSRPIPVPHFFTEIAEDGQDYSILQLPMEEWNATVLAMYYQTTHGKRLLNGFVARCPEGTDATLREWNRDPLNHAFMLRNRVRYIVLFTPLGPEPWHRRVMEIFERAPWIHRAAPGESMIIVYRVSWPGDPGE